MSAMLLELSAHKYSLTTVLALEYGMTGPGTKP